MKKILKIVICLCLALACSVSFFACDLKKGDKFYEETNAKFNEFVEQVCKNSKYSNGLIYGKNVTDVINAINDDDDKLFEYEQLKTIYDEIFKNSFAYLTRFKDVLAIAPKELTTGTKKAYKNFEKHIDSVKGKISELDHFVTKLDNNIGPITNIEEAKANIKIQYVREFKRIYITTSKELIGLCSDFLDLCQTYLFTDYDTFYIESSDKYETLTETKLDNQKSIAILKSVINTLNPAIKYLEKYNGDYNNLTQKNNDQFIQTLSNYLTLNYELDNTATAEKLQVWKGIYETYMIELDCFYSSLDEMDFDELRKNYNFNLENYAKANIEKQPFVTKIKTFYNETITKLYNAVKVLCEAQPAPPPPPQES